jgi:hypothetical protein
LLHPCRHAMTTKNGSNVYQIKHLKGAKNYAVWRIKMMDILTELGYYAIAVGTEPRPSVIDPPEPGQEWD